MLYDEEISDILVDHGVRLLKATVTFMAVGTIFCIACYACSGLIPTIRMTAIPLVVRKATEAVGQASVSLATAAQDSWVEANKEPQAPDRL